LGNSSLRKQETKMSDSLVKAYQQAIYSVGGTDSLFELRVGERSSALIALLSNFQVESWAYITSENPGSELLTSDQNKQRTQSLEAHLKTEGYRYFLGEGRSPDNSWPPEKSFLILGISENEAVGLAQTFGQKAFLMGGISGVPVLRVLF